MIEIALTCARRGWFVFPLRPRSKRPFRGSRGFKDATRDEAQIRARWTQTPDANVGIATGASGLVVLDADGPEGQAQLKRVANGDLPRTFTVRTGRPGGFHLWYAGTNVPSSQVKGEHLDVRGSTGYVLAPGSVHENGTVYTIVLDLPIAVVPTWVGQWIRSRGNGREVIRNEQRAPQSALVSQNGPPLGHPGHSLAGAAPTAQRALRALQASGTPLCSLDEINRLRSALTAIRPDIDGRTWASFGAALCDLRWHVGSLDVGLEIWDEWSRRSTSKGAGNGEYRGRADLEKRWRTFQEKNYQGVRATIASIYKMAQPPSFSLGSGTAPAAECNLSDDGTHHIGAAPAGDGTHHIGAEDGKVNGHAVPPSLVGPVFAFTPPIFPDVNKAGRPLATCRNARLAIRGLGISCSHDAFRDQFKVGGKVLDDWAGELTENTTQALRIVIEKQYRFDPGNIAAHDAAVQECLLESRDPVLDYLDELVWDGHKRLEKWLSTYLGAEDSAFNRAVSRLALAAAVRRAREPGCKFDTIIVLEGPEGRGKSTAIEILAGEEHFSDQTLLGLSDKEHQEALAGVWLFEIADLAGHSKAEVERMKAFCTRKHDRARPSFGRKSVWQPRRCVFFGTTNSDTYLKSQTGNRRFWPVPCGRIDLEGLKRDRDQLWAEACQWEERGAPLVLAESLWSDATILQEKRRDPDPWDDELATLEKLTWTKLEKDAFGRPEWRITTRDVLNRVLGLTMDRQSDIVAKRLVFSLRRLGWEGPKVMKLADGTTARGYAKVVPPK